MTTELNGEGMSVNAFKPFIRVLSLIERWLEGQKAGRYNFRKTLKNVYATHYWITSPLPNRMNPMGRSVCRETSLPMQFLTTWEHAENILGANNTLNFL